MEREDESRQLKPSDISSTSAETTRPTLARAQTLSASILTVTRPANTTNGTGPETPALQRRLAVANRFPSFLISRKAAPVQNPGTTAPSTQPNGVPVTAAPEADATAARRETVLRDALTREQSLRQTAETKLTQVNGELEDLSVTLFQQANEMVATERRARAKLEESVRLWEERARKLEERVKVLEKRDRDKGKRLARLEEAMRRVERVKRLLVVAPMGK